MALLISTTAPVTCSLKGVVRGKQQLMSSSSNYSFIRTRRCDSVAKVDAFRVKASCCFNSSQEPILKEVLKEPVAFVGGIFAGLLRLDLNEDPLKEWVTRTVEAAGIKEEISPGDVREEEEMPQQIEIE